MVNSEKNKAVYESVEELKRDGGVGWFEKKSITVHGDDELVSSPFTELIGLEVVDRLPGRRVLSTPVEKPNMNGVLFYNGALAGLEISYSDYNGILSQPCLLISAEYLAAFCPVFFYGNDKYQALMYAFEEVTDTMGLGLTFAKGWHAVNTSTYANEPFDVDAYPFLFYSEYIEEGVKAGAEEYIKGLFPLKEEISFTIKPENIHDKGTYQNVTYVALPTDSSTETIFAYESFNFHLDIGKMSRIKLGSATITYEVIHPISEKYLPGPKVIDLDTYGDTPVGTILNTLLASGGGQEIATGIDGLFADLDTDSPVVFKFTVSDVGSISVSGATIVKRGTTGVIGFSFQCITILNKSLTRVSVIMDRTGAILETLESIALSG